MEEVLEAERRRRRMWCVLGARGALVQRYGYESDHAWMGLGPVRWTRIT